MRLKILNTLQHLSIFLLLIVVNALAGSTQRSVEIGKSEELIREKRHDPMEIYELPEDDSWMKISRKEWSCDYLYLARIHGPDPKACKKNNEICLLDWQCCSWYCPFPETECRYYVNYAVWDQLQ